MLRCVFLLSPPTACRPLRNRNHGRTCARNTALLHWRHQGIGVARKKLKILKQRDSETKRLQKKFRAQSAVFLDEMQLLLQDVVGRDDAQALVDDTTDTRWNSEELQAQLKEYMGRKYEDLQETVAETRNCITALNEKLNVGIEDTTGPEVKV